MDVREGMRRERRAPRLSVAGRVDVVVHRVVGPLDTGDGHARGHGTLAGGRDVEVTFLLPRDAFEELRGRLLGGEWAVPYRVLPEDVTTVSTPLVPAVPGKKLA